MPVRPAMSAVLHGKCAELCPDTQRADRARALVLHHHDLVWRVLRRLGVPPADVDDAAQQVFWVAFQKIHPDPSPKDVSFLLSIAVRVASDRRRSLRRRREVSLESDDFAETAPCVEEQCDRVRALRLAEQMLEALPWDQRIVFILFELEEKSTAEIAEWLKLPAGTVASRLRRARTAFAKAVQRHRSRAGQ